MTHLSSVSLKWILDGAQEQGLALDPARLAALENEFDVMGPLRNTKNAPSGALNAILRLSPKDRQGPGETREMHEAAVRRWIGDDKYRPGSLKRLKTQLATLAQQRGPNRFG